MANRNYISKLTDPKKMKEIPIDAEVNDSDVDEEELVSFDFDTI